MTLPERRGDGNRWPKSMPPNLSVLTPDYDEILSVDQLRFIAEVLLKGGMVFLMSDCAWAAAVDPRHSGGVSLLDLLLDHKAHPIPVTVADESLSATVIRFDAVVRAITGRFWPGGLGIKTKPATRYARKISRRLHSGESGVVVRMSRSEVERQISATLRLAITSAALREDGALVTDPAHALDLVTRLIQERAPFARVVFILDRRQHALLCAHSTMIAVERKLVILRHGSVDVSDVQRAALSNDGVDWSDAT